MLEELRAPLDGEAIRIIHLSAAYLNVDIMEVLGLKLKIPLSFFVALVGKWKLVNGFSRKGPYDRLRDRNHVVIGDHIATLKHEPTHGNPDVLPIILIASAYRLSGAEDYDAQIQEIIYQGLEFRGF